MPASKVRPAGAKTPGGASSFRAPDVTARTVYAAGVVAKGGDFNRMMAELMGKAGGYCGGKGGSMLYHSAKAVRRGSFRRRWSLSFSASRFTLSCCCNCVRRRTNQCSRR